MHDGSTTHLQSWLERLRAGDDIAGESLITHACGRLERLARKMLHGYPRVARWEQTDDVLQGARMRLYKALKTVQPKDVKGFMALAGKLIRQQLIDLGRRHLGPQGAGAHHATGAVPAEVEAQLRDRTRYHEFVEGLPEDERADADLLFYQGMTEAEAAGVLGVSDRTVRRRWQDARERLAKSLGKGGAGAPD